MKIIHPRRYLRNVIKHVKNKFWYYLLPDSICLKIRYKEKFGKKLNLRNPQTFNEKIQWLKLHDRKPYYHDLVDKCEAKKIVGKIIGEEHIIKTLGVWDNYEDIDFSTLPDQFVLKFTHDSGSVTVCTDKSKFNKDDYSGKYAHSFANRDYYHRKYKEWVYKGIKPRIIAEEYLPDEKYDCLTTYELYCFNGKPKIMFLLINKLTPDATAYYYDMSWNRLRPDAKNNFDKPQNFELMKELAEKIARNVDNPFVRVDFYDVDGKVYFGEVTFYPDAGMSRSSIRESFGDYIDLTRGAK